jgi:hypothetical protein
MAVVFGVLSRAWQWIDLSALMPVRLVLLAAFSAAAFVLLGQAATGTAVTLGAGGLLCCGCAFALGLIRRSDFAGFTPTPQSEMAE